MKKYRQLYFAVLLIVMLMSCMGFSVAAENEEVRVYTATVEYECKVADLGERVALNRKDYGAAYSGKYGYQLSGIDRELYDSMVKNYVTNAKTASYTYTFKNAITFNASVVGNYIVPNEGYNNAEKKVAKAMQCSMDALTMDYPELFWLYNIGCSYEVTAKGNVTGGYTGYINSITIKPIEAYTGATSDNSRFRSAVDSYVKSFKNSVKDLNDRYEVLRMLHDLICFNAYYNTSGPGIYVHTPAAFFIGDRGFVCEGYAETFKLYCDRLGIPCVLVVGDANGAHMWNYVQMEDGKWYLIDTTWDDLETEVRHEYFLANYYSMGYEERIYSERSAYTDFNSAGYMNFTYPTLSTTNYVRHYHQWESTYRVDRNPTCAKEGIKSIHCTTCSAVKDSVSIPKTGHTYTYSVTKATPSVNGKRTGTCKTCKATTSTVIYKPSTMTLSGSVYNYSGNVLTPSVTVKDSKGNTLKSKVDYTVSYSSGRKLPGRYAVKVTLQGNYSGTITKYFGIAPAATTKITATQNTSAIALTWSSCTGATGYRVYRYDDSTKKYVSLGTVTGKTSYTINNLTAGTKYKLSVRAYVKTSGGDVWGNYSSLLLTSTKPSPTKNLKATQTTSTVKLTWDKVPGATGYRIYRLNNSNGKFESVGYVPGKNEYTVKKLAVGTKYKFRVRAYINTDLGAVWGGYSNELLTSTKPAKTTGLKAQCTGSEIKLTWNKVAGATGYRIYKLNPSNKKYESVGYIPGKEVFTVKGLASDTKYSFKVRAYINTDLGAVWGDYTDVLTVLSAPAKPSLSVSSTASGKATIRWSNVKNETGYELFYSTKKDSGYKKIGTSKANVTTATVSKLRSGTTYYFRVRAISKTASGTSYSGYNTVAVRVK